MKYFVNVESSQVIEVEAENENAAIELIKAQMDPRTAAATKLEIAIEAIELADGSYGVRNEEAETTAIEQAIEEAQEAQENNERQSTF